MIVVLIAAAAPLFAQGYGRGRGRAPMNGRGPGMYNAEFSGSMETVIGEIEPGSLSESEKEGILLMREEEKLARDVYLTLYEKWNVPVFANIARSEETHMDAMELLIERYGLEDPVSDEARSNRGSYAQPNFNSLYAELTEKGLSSFEAALEVGALIEDLDIADLQELLSGSGNEDVKIVYQNLLKGSRNHLRSFTMQLERYNTVYQPEHISKTDYDRIVSTRNETGVITEPDFSF